MNNVNMANMPMAGGPVGGGPMAMMGNNAALAGGQIARVPEANRANLNTYIYDYFIRERMYDCARAMLNSDQALNVHKSPRRDENGNTIGNGVGDDSMDTDSKDDIDSKRPPDLPAPNVPNSSDSCFLLEWFCLFWDILSAQRNKGGVSPTVNSYVVHTQQQNRLRQNQQHDMMRQMRPEIYNSMMQRLPNGMPMNVKHPTLARTAIANNQNNPSMQMLQAAKQGQMQRDGSNMDGNQPRPASPGSADNAPSPSKRPRLEGSGPFNPQHPNMMNGQRPQQGMPGQQVGDTKAADMAQQKLLSNGIDPANIIAQQFQNFQAQSAQTQAKSIQAYQQNLQQHHGQQMPNKQVPNPGGPQGQGSPMIAQGPENPALGAFYPEMGAGMRQVPGGAQGSGSNHALQDYQMQLMLLEQQNKKRLMMARQEQDTMGAIPRDGTGPNGPGGPGGPNGPNGQAFQDAPPQGVRPGASPNPNDQMKRGTPQMNTAGIPSPLQEGAQSRGSPNAMNFMPNGMDPNMQQNFFKGMSAMDGNMVAAQMNPGMRPPSSHPNQPFNGQMTPQMMARQQGGPQQMQWQGPNGNGMAPQGPQGPQGQVQGTPAQRAMPPPSAPAPTANGNGRTSTQSPQTTAAAPPTPQQAAKAAPKKKDAKNAKNKAAAQKNKAPAAGATPAPEANQEAEPPTPATPITPSNPAGTFKSSQNAGAVPQNVNATASAPQPAPAPVPAPQVDQMSFADMNNNNNAMFTNIPEFGEIPSGDVLPDFDFDSFLHDGDNDTGGFDFNPASFGMEPPGEIGAE